MRFTFSALVLINDETVSGNFTQPFKHLQN